MILVSWRRALLRPEDARIGAAGARSDLRTKLGRMHRGADTESRVRTIVARLAKQPDPSVLSSDADIYRKLGIASSGALDLLLTLEEELGVHLPDAEFNEARTLADLTALVARRGES